MIHQIQVLAWIRTMLAVGVFHIFFNHTVDGSEIGRHNHLGWC